MELKLFVIVIQRMTDIERSQKLSISWDNKQIDWFKGSASMRYG